ncbi:MAG: POTRA domain-containing protein, partial [Bryobacteraceae bacterium]
MKSFRHVCLTSILVCLSGSTPVWPQAPPRPAGQTPPPGQEPKKANPFEQVPQGVEPAKPPQTPPGPPSLEAPKAAAEARKPPAGANVIEAIEFRGARRVPQDTLRALIFSKKGDIVNDETLRRDFMALWNTGRFDDIRLETEPGESGAVVRFIVTERPAVRTLKYEGAKSVTVSEILDRFK